MRPPGSTEPRLVENTPAEVARVDRLVVEAYAFPSRRDELELYLAAQPDGWFAIVDACEIVAVGGALDYGSFCWIGLVATHPVRRRRGLATKISARLVDWAYERGCKTIALDASGAGRAVYERLGFRAVGDTVELSPPPSLAAHEPSSTVRRDSEDIERLLELDQRIFGGDRARLLRALWRQDAARCYVATNGEEPAGYLFARKRLLGPGCAHDDDVTSDLVRAALADRPATGDPPDQRLLLPIESRYLRVLSRLGFRVERRLTHMRHGDPRLAGERDQLLAQTSYAAG